MPLWVVQRRLDGQCLGGGRRTGDELVGQCIGRGQQVAGNGRGQAVVGDAEFRFGKSALDGVDVIHLPALLDRKSTRLNSSHSQISYAVFCLKKKKKNKKERQEETTYTKNVRNTDGCAI